MKKLRILIVEDELLFAKLVKIYLRDLGHEVAAAVTTGEEAIEKAEETKPDLVLMDIVLGGEMDGIESAGVIYSRFSIPFIYLTAHGDRETRERAQLTKPLAYLIKPIKKQELASAIDKALLTVQANVPSRE